jgi:hypothetical protein
MRTKMNSRYGLMFTLAIAAMAAIAVAGSVWATSPSQQSAMEVTRIDIAAIMASGDNTNLPVLQIENPI